MTNLSVNAALLKANSLVKKGETEDARQLYEAVLQSFPQNKRALQGLKLLTHEKKVTVQEPPQDIMSNLVKLYNSGQMDATLELAEPLIKQFPASFTVWNILAVANKGLGRVKEAGVAFKKITQLNPKYAEGFNNLGVILQELDKSEEAIEAYKKAVSLNPNYADAYYNMGITLHEQGKLEESIEAYNKAASLRPNDGDVYYNMGLVLQERKQHEEAIKAYNKALSLKPNYADTYNNIGNVLKSQDNLEEAIGAYKKAMSLKPDYAEAYKNMGDALKGQDNLEEAIGAYKKAISLKPNYAEAHRVLSTLIKYKNGDPQIQIVEQLLNNTNTTDQEKCLLHFAYAKMQEDIGNLSGALSHYSTGGKLRRNHLSYDFKNDEHLFEQIKKTAHNVKQNALMLSDDIPEHKPIFILGMPRSGTTLVEQIISSHSLVHGAGELAFLNKLVSLIALESTMGTIQHLNYLRNTYLEALIKVSNGKPFITDKMPNNFFYIGLICSAFPEAKIIHVKRDPGAICWSNFNKHFSTNGLGYSYDLKDVVQYYRLYEDLMGFWYQMYGDRIYQCDYDQLTVNQEAETRNLIVQLGLNWEDGCLSPHKNKRSIKTASQQQVRQKVYTGSSNEWRKYEPYLDGAFDVLNT